MHPHPVNRKMPGITRKWREDSFPLIRNKKNDKCYTEKRRKVAVTMSALASYLLIFTVVSSLSFVSSQPVTNLPARSNKLMTTAAAATVVPVADSPPFRSSFQADDDEGDGSKADVAFVSSSSPSPSPKQKEQEFVPSPVLPLSIPGIKLGDKKELLNQLGSPPNEGEEKEGILNKLNNHNDNDDVSLMTTQNTNKNGVFFQEKIRNARGLGEMEGSEMGRDKDKVMVTDDVKVYSSRILLVNPEMSLPPKNSGNGNLEERNSKYSYTTGSPTLKSMTMMESPSPPVNLKFEEQGNSKVNTRRGTVTTTPSHVFHFKMNQNKSEEILSTGQKAGVTDNAEKVRKMHKKDGQSGNANVVNNHANFTEHKGLSTGDINKVDKSIEEKGSNHTYLTSTPTSHSSNMMGTKGNGKSTGNGSSDSLSPSGNLKSRLTVKKMNSSEHSVSSSLDRNKELGKLNERKADEDEQQHPQNVSFLNYSSSLKNVKGEGGAGHANSSYNISSPLVMNKWIKTVVELSECLANCLDHVRRVRRELNLPLTTHQPSITSSSPEEAGVGDIGRETSSPHYPPSSSSPLQWKEEKPKMPVANAKNSSSYPPPFGTSNSPTPASTIKVTRSKSMKYYELSSCQDSCRSKFPLHGKSDVPTSERTTSKMYDADDYIVPTSKTTSSLSRDTVMDQGESQLNGEIKSGANKGNNFTTTTSSDANGNNGSNNNNNNIENQVEGSLDGKVAVDRKSNNHLEDDEHDSPGFEEGGSHYLPIETVKQALRENQMYSGGEDGEAKRNEHVKFGGEKSRKLLAIEDGSLNNLQIFGSEPGLKVQQLFRKSKGNGIESESSILLELSWPKPWEESDHALGTSGNNNSETEETFFSAQVKDKKGIDDERNLNEGSQRAEEKPITSTIYSIILEESWVGSGGYARRWKLIDQIVSKNTATIQISLLEKTRGSFKPTMLPAQDKIVRKGINEREELESGEVYEDEMGKEYQVKEKIMVKLDESPLLGAADPPSKVTLRVLAVTRKGLEKVYFASLTNNSYYHLSEPHEEKEKSVKEGMKEELVTGEYSNRLHPKTSLVSREHPNKIGINKGDSTNTKFSNEEKQEAKESGIFLQRDFRKVFPDEGQVGGNGKADIDDPSNENSNKILTFPSIESLSKTMKGLSGERQVKKLMSRLREKKKKADLQSKNEELSNRLNESEWEIKGKVEVGTIVASENQQDWGLHLVSMVYQKFLVVTQISWDFPGEDDEKDDNEDNRNNENGGHNWDKKITLTLPQDKKAGKVSLSSASKKLRGCGGGSHVAGVDTKLNFLLSWEIFGGGLRGNLVTDTCSASISLWPDTVYIIQVGLISPSPVEPTDSKEAKIMSGSNYRGKSKRENLMEEQSIAFEEDVDEVSTIWKRNNVDITGNTRFSGNKGNPAKSSSSTDDDPVVLPESISFPFEGEPKVTIKSEKILVNTTRATGNDNGRVGAMLARNQDKISLGISQSNNNFPMAREQSREELGRMMIVSAFYGRNKKSESSLAEANAGEGKNFDNVSSNSSTISRNGSVGSGGLSDKVNVTPMQSAKNDGKDGHKNGRVFALNDQPEEASSPSVAAAAGENEEEDEKDASSVWDDEDDEDEMTDQDESLFARSMAHHHSRKPVSQEAEAHAKDNLKNKDGHLITSHDSVSHSPIDAIESKRIHNFLTVNSFYQSLYALSRNALDITSRYPSVITINNGGVEGSASKAEIGIGGRDVSRTVGDSNAIPLILGEYSHANGSSKYLYGSGNDGGSDANDDSSSFQGKLYTLFVVLVISFVIFLFVVAVVGFCVLTSSIKDNYKYFVPKKVRVWTTMGQLLGGQRSTAAAGTSGVTGSNDDGDRVLIKDSAEGSFYPQRLQEEPDFEFDEDFGQDEDDEEEEASSSPETEDEEIVDLEEGECSGCCCSCANEVNTNENSFPLSERRSSILSSSSDTTLIRPGEENSVELVVASQSNDDTESESAYGRSSCRRDCKSNENCDNNNPCYHTTPGGQGSCAPLSQTTSSKASSTVSAAISSIKRNFHLGRSKNKGRNKQLQQHNSIQHTQHDHNHHHHHHHHCPKNKSDVRIEVTNSRMRTPNARLEGYY